MTCPVSKEVIRETAPDFTGHTEFLAALAGTKRFGMMLAGKRLKVSLVTIHCSMRETLRRLKTAAILETIELTHETLTRRFGLSDPAIAVAGLNPHAGEGGRLREAKRRRSSPRPSGRPRSRASGFPAPIPRIRFFTGRPGGAMTPWWPCTMTRG